MVLCVVNNMFLREGMKGFHFPSKYSLLCPVSVKQENHMEFLCYPKVFEYSSDE